MENNNQNTENNIGNIRINANNINFQNKINQISKEVGKYKKTI